MIHEIKLQKPFCDPVLQGIKTFEIRRNDRGYQAGDHVKFIPMDGMLHYYHDVSDLEFVITYVLNGYGLDNDFVVFSFKRIEKDLDYETEPGLYDGEEAYKIFKSSEEKTGHWITTKTFMHDGEFYCDQCKCASPNNEKWDYCPNCGRRMV